MQYYASLHPEIVFAAGLFVTTAIAVVGLMYLIAPQTNPLARRLRGAGVGAGPIELNRTSAGMLHPTLTRLGEATAKPFMPKDPANESRLRKKLISAGIYSPKAIHL